MGYQPGEVIIYRGANQERIWFALPVYVVRDTPELVALYWPAGTRGKWRMRAPGAKVTPQEMRSNALEIIDHTWTRTDVLLLIQPGAAHALYVMWETGTRQQLCWYVNLQDPLRRTAIGFDSMDHVLDIVFSPDKTSWRWKDEDQLEELVAYGMISPEKAMAVRAEGERVIGLFHANRSPLCDGWEHWSPPAGWGVPEMGEDWQLGY
jgi:predicted RNA-binding protein associated with RNAse of E/G family